MDGAQKILWDVATGTVYWKEEDGEFYGAVIESDNTADLSNSFPIDCWDGPHEDRIKAILATF